MALMLLMGCASKKAPAPALFTLLQNTGINFRNDVRDSKEDNGFLFRNFYNGGGVAMGDINNDGLPDVMLTSNQGDNKLYLNKGNFLFDEISVAAGLKQDGMWSTGVAMADVNADGWLDIYVCNSGHIQSGRRLNQLYINQHNNTFKEEAKAFGLDVSGYCTQASFFDYDLDGDLDCFIINNSPVPFSSLNYAGMRDGDVTKMKVDDKLKGGGNHLYRNNTIHNPKASFSAKKAAGGEPVPFTEVTQQAGIHSGLISFGLGVTVSDINNDGYPDIYVGNDFIEKDYLYINQGPSATGEVTFTDELEQRVQKISMSSMSADVADINNDGHPEIFTTDMIPDDDYRLKTTGTFDNIDLYLSKQKAGLYHQYVRNCLQLNNGAGQFSEVGNYCGVSGTDWSWGSVFFDADNNGLADIFICNGIAKDVGDLDFLDFFSNDVYAKMLETGQRMEMDELLKHIPVTPLANRMFQNTGNLQFKDAGKEWGLDEKSFSNSAAYGDLDGDGDLDLVVNNENGPAFVYRNNASQQKAGNYLAVQLKGTGANTFAIGTKIKVYMGTEVFYRELFPSRGFQSSMDYKQIIGLGKLTSVDSLLVIWPDRTYTKMIQPPLNKTYLLEQDKSTALPYSYPDPSSIRNTLLQPVSQAFDKHTEDDYTDFYSERNLPQLLSTQGPHLAKGDVNGDGLQDVYIGGAKGQGGSLYLQKSDGRFTKKEEPVFKQYADFEDVAVLFFDSDKDSDLDLFVGAGGNNAPPGARELQHRLYKNNGRGDFTIDAEAFGPNAMNISVAAAYDYDGDGDADLFVGSRSTPFIYGQVPVSYLYRNDGQGRFSDVAPPGLRAAGMITGAVWVDVDGDGKKELVVTGEWMATRIYKYTGTTFSELKATGLQNLAGWWQTITAADVNGDGREDLVIGNIGENFYLRPSADRPVKLWVADFDNNGTPDQFITQTINVKDMPVFLKRDVTEQFPSLRKANLKNTDYAPKTIQQLFAPDVLSKATQMAFNYCSSVVAINNGQGGFAVKPLPVAVQLSSMNAVCVADVNNDGRPDLLTGGNLFTFPPQLGRLDASFGDVLMNNGGGNFTALKPTATGLALHGEVKDIQRLSGKTGSRFIITQNNLPPVIYSLQKQR